jgi:5-methylcytosine-specific restriction endonuclease McrA
MNYIGCNIPYLREWFEYNFTGEMNWDNYGSYWSIDHVIPVSKFNLTNEDEKLKCWNWSNLVPATINFNSSKKDTLDIYQLHNNIEKLKKFKEEGSTTKWFSEELNFINYASFYK